MLKLQNMTIYSYCLLFTWMFLFCVLTTVC